jgi:peptidyl-lysine (3S)-dioxygenase / protease
MCANTEIAEEIRRIFTYPLEHSMKFSDFAEMLLDRKDGDAVAYLSEQNDNFRSQTAFAELRQDVPSSIKLMDETSDNGLEALNLWIGDEQSISSLHKDHYENIYAVILGTLAPTDITRINDRVLRLIWRYRGENIHLASSNGCGLPS